MDGIVQIVRLKQLLTKWRTTSTLRGNNNHPRNSRQHPGGISPEIGRRWRNSFVICDSDEEGWQSPEPPHDVPRGFLAVYVGKEYRRFIIPTAYLSHHLFKVLLEKAEEEFGFDHGGALAIPCEIETFKYLLKCIELESYKRGECPRQTPGDTVEES